MQQFVCVSFRVRCSNPFSIQLLQIGCQIYYTITLYYSWLLFQ